MNKTLDALALKVSDIADQLQQLTPFEIGYLGGIMAENRPVLAQQIAIALKLNLEDIHGTKFPIE